MWRSGGWRHWAGLPTGSSATGAAGHWRLRPAAEHFADRCAADPVPLRMSLHALIDDHVGFEDISSMKPDTLNILRMGNEDPDGLGWVMDLEENASYPKDPVGSIHYARKHSWLKSHDFSEEGTATIHTPNANTCSWPTLAAPALGRSDHTERATLRAREANRRRGGGGVGLSPAEG